MDFQFPRKFFVGISFFAIPWQMFFRLNVVENANWFDTHIANMTQTISHEVAKVSGKLSIAKYESNILLQSRAVVWRSWFQSKIYVLASFDVQQIGISAHWGISWLKLFNDFIRTFICLFGNIIKSHKNFPCGSLRRLPSPLKTN